MSGDRDVRRRLGVQTTVYVSPVVFASVMVSVVLETVMSGGLAGTWKTSESPCMGRAVVVGSLVAADGAVAGSGGVGLTDADVTVVAESSVVAEVERLCAVMVAAGVGEWVLWNTWPWIGPR